MAQGTWGIGSFKLPDLGLTELFAKPTNKTFYNTNVMTTPSGIANTQSVPLYNVQAGTKTKINPVSYNSITSSGSGGVQTKSAEINNPYDVSIPSPDQNTGGGPSEMDVINGEFNAFNSYLDSQAGTANQNFTETKGLYDTNKANAEKQYQLEKTQQTEGIAKNESLNLAKVRQLLSDLSQRDAARTAITGGGSVSEALAERFGRQAQGNLGNVINSSQQALERVGTFYNNALTKLQESYDSNILQAKQALQDNLSQIQNARIQSASVKQQSTLSAWRDYYNNVNQAKIQAADFKAKYDMWKQQQDNMLGATAGFNLANQDTYTKQIEPSLSLKSPGAVAVNTADTGINPYFDQFTQNTNQDEYLRKLGLTGSTA